MKSASIKKGEADIALLTAKIEQTEGGSGELSSDLGSLKASLAENTESQTEATNIRGTENTAFLAAKADFETAISSMKSAIEQIAEVGADQTKASGADHKQFLAGHKGSLLSL